MKSMKSICPSVAKKTADEEEYDDDSLSIKEILPEDEEGSIVLPDMKGTSATPKRGIDNNFLNFVSQQHAA